MHKQGLNMTGKYKKPEGFSLEQANKALSRERDSAMYDEADNMSIEKLASMHFASHIDNSYYTDGIDSCYNELSVIVCPTNPIVYEISHRLETCLDEDDVELEWLMKIAKGEPVNFDDCQGVMTLYINIEALWNSQQNVLYVSKDECNTAEKLLDHFTNKPKIVSKEMFYCILAYC